MNYRFPDNPLWLAFVLGIFFSSIGFILFHFLNNASIVNRLWNHRERDNVRNVIFRRLSGIMIFLLLPLFLFYFITGENLLYFYTGSLSPATLYWYIPLASLLVFINYLNSRSEDNLRMYPEIRNGEWSKSLIFLSALSWIAYLFAYEFLFRGLLLVPAVKLTGFWPAVILNTGIYSLVHLHKGIKEGIGSVFLGFVLCILVIRTGSFWIAFFIHVTLALSSEWFSLRAHPQMNIVK